MSNWLDGWLTQTDTTPAPAPAVIEEPPPENSGAVHACTMKYAGSLGRALIYTVEGWEFLVVSMPLRDDPNAPRTCEVISPRPARSKLRAIVAGWSEAKRARWGKRVVVLMDQGLGIPDAEHRAFDEIRGEEA